MSNELLPTSDYVLAKLCMAILPANDPAAAPADTEALYFLRDLAELCYREDIDLARAFFEYFCIDPYTGVIADVIKRHPDCEDYISETLESTYSDVGADPVTKEPCGIPEFGLDAEHLRPKAQTHTTDGRKLGE